ncbi:hypothetical protein BDW60DRAFT_177251, partial [Aspergillus nidulans var. acristatus]
MSVLVLQALVVFSLSLMVPMDSLLIVPSTVARHKERVLPGRPHYSTLRTYLTLNADQVAFFAFFFLANAVVHSEGRLVLPALGLRLGRVEILGCTCL